MSHPSFVIQSLKKWALQSPERIALRSETGWQVTFAELERWTAEGAEELIAAGLKPFDLVLLALPHTLETAVQILVTLRAGLVGLLTSPRETADEISPLLMSFPFRAVALSPEHPLRGGLSARATQVRAEARANPGRVEWWLPPRTAVDVAELAEQNVRWTLRTSGSTGESKVVMMDDRNLEERARGEIACFGIQAEDRLLNWLTFSHDLGLNQLLTAVNAGATLEIHGFASSAEILRRLDEPNVAGVTGTPGLWREVLRVQPEPRTQGPRFLTVSGGALSDEQLADLRRVFPRTRVIRTYGQSETFRSLIAEGGAELSARVPGVEVTLTTEGELIHFGAGLMCGYLADAAATRTKLVAASSYPDISKTYKNGLLTGDFFERRPNGGMHFVGRRDDLFKRRDFRISLHEIERAFSTHAALVEVAASYFPADGDDGRLVLFAIPKPATKISTDELVSFGRKVLSRHKAPDKVILLEDFPRTAVGKVNKLKLKRHALEVGL